MVLVIEPNAVTADGMFGIFFGHTFIITEGEPECVDGYPWELTVPLAAEKNSYASLRSIAS